MLTNISLANFRGFEEEISVRIRPITILIGRNSAGKSSLIKFLQMLRQTLESQRDEFLVTNDRTHILDRRKALLKKTKRERGRNTDIQCSNDAFRNLHGTGESA